MSIVIYSVVYAANVFNSFVKKKKKILPVFLFVLMMLLFCQVMHSPTMRSDYDVYKYIYDEYWNGRPIYNFDNNAFFAHYNFEPGYTLLSFIFARMHVPYNVYLALIFLACSVLYLQTIKKITHNYSYVLILYVLFYFLYDIQQVRNFVAYSIVLFGISYLKEKKIWQYILIILIAALFHVSSLFFLIFLLTCKRDLKKYAKLVLELLIILVIILGILNFREINIMNSLVSLVYNGAYLDGKFNHWRPFVILLHMGYFAYLSRKIDIRVKNEWTRLIYEINVISFIIIPFLMVNMTFERLARPVLLLDYALFAEYCSDSKVSGKRLTFNGRFIEIIMIFVLSVIRFFISGYNLLIWIFQSNSFIQWLG